jgi:hypothetical protein
VSLIPFTDSHFIHKEVKFSVRCYMFAKAIHFMGTLHVYSLGIKNLADLDTITVLSDVTEMS